jgi:microcystin-dependent protein
MASQPFMGQIQAFGFPFNIVGWVPCDGRLLSIAENTALFTLVGTTYGGDGQSTFGVPDLRGRVPIGMGNGQGLSPRTIGQFAGTESVTLLQSQMPTHSHVLTATGGNFMVSSQNGTAPAPSTTANTIGAAHDPANNNTNNAYNNILPDITLNTGAGSASATISVSGGSQPVENLEPFLVINYSLCTEGIFPSRN